MSNKRSFSAPVGTHDVLPPQSLEWERAIGLFSSVAHLYGFGLVINPIFEDVGVFNRGIGENSDVAKKEMYVFQDRSDRKYALRPEGTASVVRSYVQHNPTPPWKVFYVTPAFRYERPQAGRYRQHHQLGVEALGTADPNLDIEVIAMAWRFYASFGLRRVDLMVNSMGDAACRPQYIESLNEHLRAKSPKLCDEHQRTFSDNPLRVLDCKTSACIEVTQCGPMLNDSLCDECREHFSFVTQGLSMLKIPWASNSRLVRGFDYYTRTTFEFTSTALESAQNAIGGGGRYDGLVEELGGEATPGIGFGSGIERLLLAHQAEHPAAGEAPSIDAFVVDTTGDFSVQVLMDELRTANIRIDQSYDGRSMKSQLKVADRSGARLALLIGPQELSRGEITMRYLRENDESSRQISVPRDAILSQIKQYLSQVKQ